LLTTDPFCARSDETIQDQLSADNRAGTPENYARIQYPVLNEMSLNWAEAPRLKACQATKASIESPIAYVNSGDCKLCKLYLFFWAKQFVCKPGILLTSEQSLTCSEVASFVKIKQILDLLGHSIVNAGARDPKPYPINPLSGPVLSPNRGNGMPMQSSIET
jgi:hypothetical protein